MVRVKCCTQGNQICYHNGLSTCLTDLVGQSWWGKGQGLRRIKAIWQPCCDWFFCGTAITMMERSWYMVRGLLPFSERYPLFYCWCTGSGSRRAGKKINPIVTFANIDLLYSSQHIDGLEQDCSISIANTLGYCSLAPSHRNLSHNVCGCADWPSLEPNICSEWLSQ